MLSLGYDVGSSSIKASIIDIETGKHVAGDHLPKEEMNISSPHTGFAEQDPEMWWQYVKEVTKKILRDHRIDGREIKCIGISYQMHGLVLVDEFHNVLRPSIIWCDSRSVHIGTDAFHKLGKEYCLEHFLNSPGSFTASTLKWVKENEPAIFRQAYKMMLPGEFIAMKLTDDIVTTISGLSEGIFWDFKDNSISDHIMSHYGLKKELLPKVGPTFSIQGSLTSPAAQELGLKEGTPVSYRAGDQPNNAFSLNVLEPGEVAATAGTSGVVYGIIDQAHFDPRSRVNVFAHVNHTRETTRMGALLCINGTGILFSWLRKLINRSLSYEEMNHAASTIPMGSDGLSVLPFGNGAERVLNNLTIGCHFLGLDFNRHTSAHIFRAAQEGIAFSFKYGIDIMKEMGLEVTVIRAGNTNMFLSPVFSHTLSDITGASIELYDTDGAQGAARGAAVGAGYYRSVKDAFLSLKKMGEIKPQKETSDPHLFAYRAWLTKLNLFMDACSEIPSCVI
jgi:xylulokinase